MDGHDCNNAFRSGNVSFTKERHYRNTMSDQLFVTGPEANITREDLLLELQKAENCDCSTVQELLAEAFCREPKKTISEMEAAEILEHKYKLEAMIRTFRIHLQHTINAETKLRKKHGKLAIDKIDATKRPRPVPTSRQANNEDLKLAERLAEKKGIELDEALALIREMDKPGKDADKAAKAGPAEECDYCDKPATFKRSGDKACDVHKKEITKN
jgi:ribosomal protein L22